MLCSCCAGASSSSKSWGNILDAPVTLSIAATKALLSAILSTLFCWLNISHGSRATLTCELVILVKGALYHVMEERLIWIGYLLAADYCAYRPVAEAYCQKLRPFLSEARFWSTWQNGIVYSFCKDSAVKLLQAFLQP